MRALKLLPETVVQVTLPVFCRVVNTVLGGWRPKRPPADS